jgi:plastocyanin
MMINVMGFLILFIFGLGLIFSTSFAEILATNDYTLEGSGFAVTEKTINTSEIDLVLLPQKQTSNNLESSINGGLISLDNDDFLTTELNTIMLREGKYIRINGIAESNIGDHISFSFFGKLVEKSKDASIYGLTGKITLNENDYKIIYTAKLSKINVSSKESKINEQLTIDILKGSSTPGADSYVGIDTDALKYFSRDRISIEPGTIIIINKDTVPHSIHIGRENYGDRYDQFTADGRISTGNILPGQSITITFDKPGFYRLYDPNYQWMKIIAYVFPKTDNIILGQGQNLGN